MAEPTCLLRSLSHPSDSSRETQPGDPYPALTESISLGRFMSESLAWEKWSTFSHNRYLEEAEKISRPGTVAERKAYFEAHYKRRAAEKAAALLDVIGVANEAFVSETKVGECNNSFVERKSKEDIQAICSKQQDSDSREAAHTAGVDRDDGEIKQDESSILKREKSALQHHLDVDVTEQGNCEIERNAIENNKMEIEVQALESIGNTDLSLKSCSTFNGINQSDYVKTNDNVVNIEEIRKTNENMQWGLDVKTNKVAERSSAKLKTSSSIPKPLRSISELKVPMNSRDSKSGIPKTKKPVAHLVDTRRSTPKSLHVSIDLTSCTGQRNKTRCLISEQNSERKNNAVSSNVPKGSSVGSQNPTRLSINGIQKKKTPAKPISECRRSVAQFTKSMVGEETADMKLSSLSVNFSSSSTRSNARPPIISSPFRFRSEERATKRKEFLQRLEEKTKHKEAEKVQFQTRLKEKVEHESKKLCQSFIFSSGLTDGTNSRLESSSSQVKVLLTRPGSPNLGRKSASSFTRETSIRRPWRPPTAAGSKSKDVPKHNLPVISLRKKSSQENASPNVHAMI